MIEILFLDEPLIPAQLTDNTQINSDYKLLQAAIESIISNNAMTRKQPTLLAIVYNVNILHKTNKENEKHKDCAITM